MNTTKVEPSEKIATRMVTRLDQLIQILEISFIFLLIFSLMALVEAVFTDLNFYGDLGRIWLGADGIGPLDGGNYEEIVRITLIFNLLLFTFSLVFGLWMRRTRDGWTFAQMGYTISTPGYSFVDLLRRGILLGFVAMVVFYIFQMVVFAILPDTTPLHAFVYFRETDPEVLFTPFELRSVYYFGIVEMGFIWPASAGFFFFAYAHNSLRDKFPVGVANLLATFFYVFYLQFFFLIPGPDKISVLGGHISALFTLGSFESLGFWGTSISLWIILYINFSAFAETKSIVLPFIMNFVFNVGITLLQAGNTLIFGDIVPALLILPILVVVTIVVWYFLRSDDFSTIKLGIGHLRGLRTMTSRQVRDLMGFILLFIALSFILPGLINELLSINRDNPNAFEPWFIPVLYAANFILLIVLATLVLTYEPTNVWDVLLISKQGTPIASHIELFETDDVLISGFITALAAVDEELSSDSGLKSIKRGEREILVEDGIFSRVIALVDKDHNSIRQEISNMHREFEVTKADVFEQMTSVPSRYPEAKDFVSKIGDMSLRFNISPQTRWITIVSLALAPIMISFIGLI